MQKRTKKRTHLDLTKPVERPRMPLGVMLRMFLLGSVSVIAASYALYRHYFVPRPSMLAPAAPELLPAPPIVPVP